MPGRTAATLWLALVLALPLPAQERWRIVEELRIGGADEGPAAFSDLRGLAVDGQGRMFVLDFATQDIRIFDRSGRHLRTVGRPGSGPGEFRNANGIVLAPDGALWINDPSNSRFTVLDPDGGYRASHVVPNTSIAGRWLGYFDQAGRLNDPITLRQPGQPPQPTTRRFSADLTLADTLPPLECPTGQPPPAPPAQRVQSGDR